MESSALEGDRRLELDLYTTSYMAAATSSYNNIYIIDGATMAGATSSYNNIYIIDGATMAGATSSYKY